MRRFTRIGEVPFTSDRKLMSTIEIDHERADQKIIITKGAPDLLLDLCSQARIGLEVVPLTSSSENSSWRVSTNWPMTPFAHWRSGTARLTRVSKTCRRVWSGT